MKNKIFGVDLSDKVTPLMVRDAVINCFSQAHCDDSGIGLDSSKENKVYCEEIVKKAFRDSSSDFENPSKDDILRVVEELEKFSENFRDPEIIKKHVSQIAILIKKL